MSDPSPLRLAAETEEDLQVIAAAVQDAVIKAGNLKFEARKRRFGLALNRFRWEHPELGAQRVRSLLAFDSVLGVKSLGITKSDPELILSLLQITFMPDAEPPGGVVRLIFAGDGEITLEVEVLDVSLLDSDYVWPTKHTPSHERRRR